MWIGPIRIRIQNRLNKKSTGSVWPASTLELIGSKYRLRWSAEICKTLDSDLRKEKVKTAGTAVYSWWRSTKPTRINYPYCSRIMAIPSATGISGYASCQRGKNSKGIPKVFCLSIRILCRSLHSFSDSPPLKVLTCIKISDWRTLLTSTIKNH